MGINNNTINWTSGNNLNKERKTGRGMKGKMPVSDIFPNATVTASKSATHTWGLKHQAVHVIFIYCPDKDNGLKEEQILLAQRSFKKAQWPGFWDIAVGEHIMEGDGKPIDVAENTVKAELGPFWEKPTCKFSIRDIVHYKSKIDNELKHVFIICKDNLRIEDLKKPNPEDTAEYRLFSKKDFEDLLKKRRIDKIQIL